MLVSVIVPVYNVAQFLEECIQSILKQDFEDFELILINDGSTDNSGEICNKYTSIDERVKVFHKENGGVSSARNLGIEKAKGKWITFIDSDDTIQENYFKGLISNLDSDWVLLKIEREISFIKEMDMGNKSYSLNEFVNSYFLYPHFPESCAKFFKLDIIKSNDLFFNTVLKFGEDSLFNLRYIKFCKIISTSNKSGYNYKNAKDGLSKLKYDLKNDYNLYNLIDQELDLNYYPLFFREKTISIPLSRYVITLYKNQQLNKIERKQKLKICIEKYYNVHLSIYTNPKIKFFLILSYYTRSYFVLDFIFRKSYIN